MSISQMSVIKNVFTCKNFLDYIKVRAKRKVFFVDCPS
jgi:hypothetical protein